MNTRGIQAAALLVVLMTACDGGHARFVIDGRIYNSRTDDGGVSYSFDVTNVGDAPGPPRVCVVDAYDQEVLAKGSERLLEPGSSMQLVIKPRFKRIERGSFSEFEDIDCYTADH